MFEICFAIILVSVAILIVGIVLYEVVDIYIGETLINIGISVGTMSIASMILILAYKVLEGR
ncbi:MAG: hypothetical protein ACRCX2_23945 [Paraclostridium sp.]